MLPHNTAGKSLLPSGTYLQSGRYVIDRYISSGGFGNTYLAIERLPGGNSREVVIKELFVKGITERNPDSSVRVSNADNLPVFDELFAKFRNEANRQRAIDNPYVVRVYDHFEQFNTAYMVMQYVKGDSLYSRINTDRILLTTPQVWKLLDQLTRALNAVHACHVFHLDIKPANVMIDLDGDVKLIDFGASKQQNFSERASISIAHTVMCFTPGYAPGEQVQRIWKSIGPWTDLYSLGGTIYAAVTGNKPPTSSDILEEHDRAFDFTGVDPMLANIIIWLMQPSKNERPQSVDELRGRLLRAGVINAEGIYGDDASLLPIAHEYTPSGDDSGVVDVSETGRSSQSNSGNGGKDDADDISDADDSEVDRVVLISADKPAGTPSVSKPVVIETPSHSARPQQPKPRQPRQFDNLKTAPPVARQQQPNPQPQPFQQRAQHQQRQQPQLQPQQRFMLSQQPIGQRPVQQQMQAPIRRPRQVRQARPAAKKSLKGFRLFIVCALVMLVSFIIALIAMNSWVNRGSAGHSVEPDTIVVQNGAIPAANALDSVAKPVKKPHSYRDSKRNHYRRSRY